MQTDKTGNCKAAFLAHLIAENEEEELELLQAALENEPVTPAKAVLKPKILANRKLAKIKAAQVKTPKLKASSGNLKLQQCWACICDPS